MTCVALNNGLRKCFSVRLVTRTHAMIYRIVTILTYRHPRARGAQHHIAVALATTNQLIVMLLVYALLNHISLHITPTLLLALCREADDGKGRKQYVDKSFHVPPVLLLRYKCVGYCSRVTCGSCVVDVEQRRTRRLQRLLAHTLITARDNTRSDYLAALIERH